MKDLEAVEPELAEYVFESLSDLHQRIFTLSGSSRTTRHVYQRMQTLVLVSIASLRAGHFELWQRSEVGQQLDPASHDHEPPAPSPPR
jgi:hypothetical protein